MIKLDVVDHHAFRQVVEEFRALVEEGRVVFVALEDGEFRFSEARAAAEVFRQAADHESGIFSGIFKQPGKHRRCGGLAVGAGNDEVSFAAKKVLLHHFGQGMVEQFAVEGGLGFGVSARNCVADDHHIGIGRDVLFVIAFGDRNALVAQEIRHRRVDICIRSGDDEASLFHGGRDRAHGGATDAGEVKTGFVGHAGCEAKARPRRCQPGNPAFNLSANWGRSDLPLTA